MGSEAGRSLCARTVMQAPPATRGCTGVTMQMLNVIVVP